jgi:type I restriction enzyme M protein
MLGAIVGDIVGSVYEFDNHRSKEFPLFQRKCFATDDSIMTLAIAKALLETEPLDIDALSQNAVEWMQTIGRPYPNCGYGGRFLDWMYSSRPRPYGSYGNGAAMRVSPVAYVAKDTDDCMALSEAVTRVTHNHPEGIKGAEATAVATFMGLHGYSKTNIQQIMNGYYDLNFTLDEIRSSYRFNETCQRTVPQAIVAFLESTGFEDAIRNAISIGGDSDTLAAITGSIAGAYYGVPDDIAKQAYSYLDSTLSGILDEFERKYMKQRNPPQPRHPSGV